MQRTGSIASLMAAAAMFGAMPGPSRPGGRGGGGPAKQFKTRKKPKKKPNRGKR